jgi:murein DD-endopeptidase MepM/ murein hydrolase activator NlpD
VIDAWIVSAALAAGGWGADVNSGEGAKLLEAARPELLAIVKAPPAQRAALASDFAKQYGDAWIEAVKRVRNPELVALERALLDVDDWHVQHRALLLAEALEDTAVVPLAWKRLESPAARLRERAAVTCLLLWNPKTAKDVAGGKAKESLAALIPKEGDEHVRAAMHALEKRIDGKLAPRKVASEHLVTLPDGLVVAPFLEGMDHLAQVAPGVKLTPSGSPGGSSASKLPVVTRWTTPLLGYGEEEVQGVSLQPFANPREHGVVHTGQDVGACLDGAGLYAIADGVVRFVYGGSDMGTLIVVEHHLSKKELVNAVYMHCGPSVLVQAGDAVSCGQLIGTMGLGFSIENGGHFAHLHLGLYPGPFNVLHNYGYKNAKDGLDDWFDPAKKLAEWVGATKKDEGAPKK